MGSDQGEARVRGQRHTGFDIQAVAIHRNRDQLRPGLLKKAPGLEVARVFEPAAIAIVQQAAAYQVEAGSVPGADENLFRCAGNPP
ncbi:hypothetical protein D3C72_2075900 [compost metagenome]